MKSIKTIIKGILIIGFLYVAFFGIQNFWQGYHDVDVAFNFANFGYVADTNTAGQVVNFQDIYFNGLLQMRMAFIWITIDCILAVVIGYLFRGRR